MSCMLLLRLVADLVYYHRLLSPVRTCVWYLPCCNAVFKECPLKTGVRRKKKKGGEKLVALMRLLKVSLHDVNVQLPTDETLSLNHKMKLTFRSL